MYDFSSIKLLYFILMLNRSINKVNYNFCFATFVLLHERFSFVTDTVITLLLAFKY